MELSLARWADSVCVLCVLRQYFGTPPYTVNASAQWNRCGNVKGCPINPAVQKKKDKVPFLQTTADLLGKKKLFRRAENNAEVAGGPTSSHVEPVRKKKSLFI